MASSPLNWKAILIIVLTAILCLGFYYGYKLYKIFASALEGFQTTGACPQVDPPSWDVGPESSDEIMTYDTFEMSNTPNMGDTMPTNMDKYDSAAALAEFDDNAPVPWDFDNKDDDPVDVLWGYVDTRCSMYLWDRARMRALFGTANNFEVGDDGKVAYYSGYLNGMVFHDESQINAVKYLEFFIDFYAEQVIEGVLDPLKPGMESRLYVKAIAVTEARKAVEAGEKAFKTMDKGVQAAKAARAQAIAAGQSVQQVDEAFKTAFKANVNADEFLALQPKPARTLDQVVDDMMTAGRNARGAAGATDDAFEAAFRSRGVVITGALDDKASKIRYNAVRDAKMTELLPAARGADEVARGTGYLSRAKGAIDDVLKGVKTAIKQTLRAIAQPFLRLATLTGKQLTKLGAVRGAIILAKAAAKRVARIMAMLAQKVAFVQAAFAALPFPFNFTLQVIDLTFTIVVLAIIPQVLSVMADLDEEPDSDNCNDQKQGCPTTHPFNLRCAMIKSAGPAFYEFFTAIPFVGDIIGSFAPYVCMNDKLESVFRQSMRPPPYFFDTTLSLFYCEKPNVMDGSTGRGDDMYYDPGVFKLYNNRTDSLTLAPPPGVKMQEGDTKNYFVPWVDFSHPTMLNKMAEFYMRNSKKNQAVDMDGFVSFEFISSFKGLIASSQLSCDVQVELREIRTRPISDQPVDANGCPITAGNFTLPIPSPWEISFTSTDPSQIRWRNTIAPSSETGYTFHDRRFYFIVDYKQVTRLPKFRGLDFRGLDSAGITDLVQQALTRVTSADRMEAYRAMYVVCGCTHVNGCAADIIDITADGNYLGDAPVSLGNNGSGYLAPTLDVSSLNNASELPQSSQCGAQRSVINKYGTRGFGPSKADPKANKSSDGDDGPSIYLPDESEFYGITEKTEKTSLGSVTNTADLPTTDPIGSVRVVTSEQKAYIYTTYRPIGIYPIRPKTDDPNTGWFPYNPMPVWKANTSAPQNDRWLDCTTKYWQVTEVTKSMKEQAGTGLLGATMALGPLLFGFKGGMIVTTADVAGVSNAIACTYLDMLNQTGTFVLNGFVKTSQDKFFIDKGPAIRYAPGWIPDNAYNLLDSASKLKITRLDTCSPPTSTAAIGIKCPPGRILNQSVCANRKAIRIMAKVYKTQNGNRRRVKRIFSILPTFDTTSQRNMCVYDIHSVDALADGTDGTDVRPETIMIPYGITENSRTCEFTPIPSSGTNVTYSTRTPITIMQPIPPDMTAFNPPLTIQDFDRLQNRTDIGFVPISCTTTTTIGGQLNTLATQTYSTTSGDAATKRTAAMAAVANVFNCDRPSIRNSLIDQFNSRFQKVDGDPSKGYNVQILSVQASKTPLPVGGARGVPVCYYNASVAVQKNYYDTSPTTQTHIIKMNLQPDPTSPCGYQLLSHDFPVNYYHVPVPNEENIPFEMPAEVVAQRAFSRSTCDYNANPTYKDCSGFPIMDRLVTQFNAKNSNRKILRVTRASTPQLSSGPADVCEYEVDMLRKPDVGQPAVERDTIRMTLTPTTDTNVENSGCLFDLDTDTSPNRLSGKTINKNSASQLLSADYMWPTSFAKRVRKTIGDYFLAAYPSGIPIGDSLKKASKGLNDKLNVLKSTITTSGSIIGCPTTQCTSNEIVVGFINRYNYDNTPPYPQGQFGVVQRSIVSARRTGLSDPNTCHIEVIERTQQFTNYLKEPKPNTPDADKLIRSELKYYAFTITNSSAGPNGICQFKVMAFPTDPKERSGFDVTRNPTGIPMGAGTNINLPSLYTYTQRVINGYNLKVLNAVRTAVAALTINQPYLGDSITGVSIETITSYCNVRPNIIEYSGTLVEIVNVPDMGPVSVKGTGAIITCTWPETAWDPTMSAFIGATWDPATCTYNDANVNVPLPSVEIFIPDRVEIKDQTITLYGREYPNPPYLYLGADVDPQTEVGKVQLVNPGNVNAYIKLNPVSGAWEFYKDATTAATSYSGGGGNPTIPLGQRV